ncbi:sensor histidine kinase [Nocardioides aestuarii]|uniref:Sensor histidine kinase n=1 Tax=Nocardioides aestuarii TaxID=252231 RepID=A0ABW4TVM9_9ACTN
MSEDLEETQPLRVADAPRPVPTAPPAWIALGEPTDPEQGRRPVAGRRIAVQLLAGIVIALVTVTIGGSAAARRLAEREAVNDSAAMANLLAETVVQPALTDDLLAGDPEAQRQFDTLVRDRVMGERVVRIKIWGSDGTVLYADQAELIGQVFTLDARQRDVLATPRTVAEVSDLDRAENVFDHDVGDKLVEVYRPVWTSTGQVALFEIYTPYDLVSERTGQLWRGFAGVTISTLLLFVVLLTPLIWHLAARARRDQRHREQLLERAVDASENERRRIAASLHDGPVQDLAATSFVIAGATARAEASGRADLAGELHGAAQSVRTSIRSLRTLLVDIYPPSLGRAGLSVALSDLAQSERTPGLEVRIEPLAQAVDLGLDPEQERLVYRVAQETLRNAAKHATPCVLRISLSRRSDDVVLDVVDDGPGFDVARTLAEPERGHLGLQLLAELASTGGATLQVASAPGHGTRWRLRIAGSAAGSREVPS